MAGKIKSIKQIIAGKPGFQSAAYEVSWNTVTKTLCRLGCADCQKFINTYPHTYAFVGVSRQTKYINLLRLAREHQQTTINQPHLRGYFHRYAFVGVSRQSK